MKLLVIAASHRPASLNRLLATQAAEALTQQGAMVDFPDYSALDMPIYNDFERERGHVPDAAVRLRDRMASASGLVIASPEYNWSLPASLKNAIDWISHFSPCPLTRKTALLMSASPSRRGGMLGLSHLRQVMESLDVYIHPSMFCLPEANRAFGEDGQFTDPGKTQRLSETVADYLRFTKALVSRP